MRLAIPIPTPPAIIGAITGSRRRPARVLPISDTDPDPGLFGPGSVTWRVMREPVLILGGGRALLLQAAHPLVAQGAIDHSSYATDPFGRLERTLTWVTAVTFGTTREARAASRTVTRLHRRVSGTLPARSGTPAVPAGTGYAAVDPELLLWVHATFVDTMLATHDAFVGGLSEADADTFVREWHAVAHLMGVPRRLLWSSRAALRAYVDGQIASGMVRPGSGSRHVATTIVRPPLPSAALAPLWDVVAFATVGLVPADMRRAYGFLWTPAHTAAHRALRLWVRSARPFLGERMRTSPVYDFAVLRTRGELVTTGVPGGAPGGGTRRPPRRPAPSSGRAA